MKKAVAVAMLLCFAVSAFAEGMYWQSKTEGLGTTSITENFSMPKKFKVVRTGDSKIGNVVIARLDKGLFWTLQPEKKTYTEMTFDDMEQMMTRASAKMDAAMAKMREQMKNMPADQREMMEKMMAGKMPGATDTKPIEVKSTGEKKTISGYACTKYSITSGGEVTSTMWITKDVKPFASLMNDWKEFSRRMLAMTSRFAKGTADAYKNLDGFPIQTIMKIGNSEVTTTVTTIEQRSTADNEFEIPAGYTKEEAKWKKELGNI